MRILLILACLATPALAGTRATYVGADGKRLVVEAADNGDARIGEAGASDYGILRGGQFYVVGDAGGTVSVARSADVADAIDRVVPPIFRGVLAGKAQPSTLRIEAKGAASLGGRAGQRYAVYGLDPAHREIAEEYVVSADATLKPVGAALEGFMNAALLPSAALVGPAVAGLIADTRTIFALGTPLAAGTRLRLESVTTTDVPAARVLLPARPLSVDQLVAAMRAGRKAQ